MIVKATAEILKTDAGIVKANAKPDSRATLLHEYRTPVNHIIGYTELLIEDAEERHLTPFVPILQRIQREGYVLMESLRNCSLDDPADSSVRVSTLEISSTLNTLAENLESEHRQTMADLEAISWAVRRLLALETEEGEIVSSKSLSETAASRCAGCTEGPSPNRIPVPLKRNGGKILIADDDATNRNLLRRRLECDGHQVVEVCDGREVIAALERAAFDLVLLDILMPFMDGFETLARMKADANFRELPVIMISALDEMQSVVRCIEMGAEDYLFKPFNRVLLRARIGATLEKKWLRDRERSKTEELEQTLRLLEQAQEQLAIHASRDALTGLPNRRSLEAHLDYRIERGTPFSAIYIDLNGFKKINDSYGHAAGDEVLRQVGTRLQSAFRVTDVIGRWGGDEFVALADPGFADEPSNINRIVKCLAPEFVIVNECVQQRIAVGAALGIATWRPGDTAAEVLHRADFAMYEEKLRTGS